MPEKILRRRFLKTGLGAVAVTAIGMHARKASLAKKEIGDRTGLFLQARIKFAPEWAEFSVKRFGTDIGRFPLTEKEMVFVSAISEKAGVPIDNVMKTIRMNDITKFQVEALGTKIKSMEKELKLAEGSKRKEAIKAGIERRKKIRDIVEETLRLPGFQRQKIIDASYKAKY